MRTAQDITAYARGHIIEQIMALTGRSHSNPRRYRSWLERQPLARVGKLLFAIINSLDK